MAKIKIQGHASGTGILTITAPNTSTDRTITLPDSTDTLAVNSDVTNKLPLAGGNLTGNLGIGETSPATSIHITSDTPKIRLEHTNDNGYAEIYTSAQSAIVLDADPGNTDNGTPIVFKTDGTERMRVLDSGGLTFNGDTAAANALDDYEEGTWTPTVNSSGTISINTSRTTYTKIGRMVMCKAFVDVTSVTSGDFELAGLPFTPLHNTAGGEIMINYGNITGGSTYHLSVYVNTTPRIKFYRAEDNGPWAALQHGNLSGSSELYFTATYFT